MLLHAVGRAREASGDDGAAEVDVILLMGVGVSPNLPCRILRIDPSRMQAIPVHTDGRGECLGAGERHLLGDVYRARRQFGERGENASVERCHAIAAGVHDAVDEQAGERGALVWCQYHHGVGVAGVVCDFMSAICVSHLLLPFLSDLFFEDLSKKAPSRPPGQGRARRGPARLRVGARPGSPGRRSLAAADA